jgi:hypothetical protein
MFAMNQISYWILPLMKWSQWARNSERVPPAPTTPPDRLPRNGELIVKPDSWRKIRETAAILYRENVRVPLPITLATLELGREAAYGRSFISSVLRRGVDLRKERCGARWLKFSNADATSRRRLQRSIAVVPPIG